MIEHLATKSLTLVALLSYVTTCLRLLAYKRGMCNYRFTMSVMAWLLILFTGTSALEIALHPVPVSMGTAGIAVTLLVLVWRARGNVASITRSQP